MDFPTQIALCFNIAMKIVIASTGLTAAIILIYIVGFRLGHPFGQMLLPYIRQVVPDTGNIQSHDEQTPSQPASINYRYASGHKLARDIGAILAFFFCFLALLIELFLEGQKDITEEAYGWDLWRRGTVLARACVEGLLTLVILRGIRYAGHWLLG